MSAKQQSTYDPGSQFSTDRQCSFDIIHSGLAYCIESYCSNAALLVYWLHHHVGGKCEWILNVDLNTLVEFVKNATQVIKQIEC